MRTLKLIAVALLLLLNSVSANAGEFEEVTAKYIYTGAWSFHVDTDDHPVWNSRHDLLGFQYKNWMVGSYSNSYGNEAYIIGRVFDVGSYGHFNFSILAGADYGYHSCKTDKAPDIKHVWCPALMPAITYTKYNIQPSIAIMGRALTAQIRWRWE